MKTILSFFFLLFSLGLLAQDHYYYYFDEQIPLNLDKRFLNISVAPGFQESALNGMGFMEFELRNEITEVDGEVKKFARLQFVNEPSEAVYYQTIDSLKNINGLETVSPGFTTLEGLEIGTSSYFYVKLKNEGDYDLLQTHAQQKQVMIHHQNQFMPLWYTLRCTENTPETAIELANYFQETGIFSTSAPDILSYTPMVAASDTNNCEGKISGEPNPPCVGNDPLLAYQWAFNVHGYYDIAMCDAWNITEGDSDVVVAVLDQGFRTANHPDLANVTLSYDTESSFNNPIPQPSQLLGNHGVAVAGIIGAQKDNQEGIAGVAPGCTLMDVSNSLSSFFPNSREARANGINWAWENGADIINNSWSTQSPYSFITDAINNALTNGRSGKGTIVIGSAGNYYTQPHHVGWPAEYLGVMAVGAIFECGWRVQIDPINGCPASGFGSEYGGVGQSTSFALDVVAPGFLIATTDRVGTDGYNPNGDYMVDFGGTSAAAAYVSGVAALMLSVNPCLTYERVDKILDATSFKHDLYTYSTEHLNSSNLFVYPWNEEVGHGILDALSAVQVAENLYSPTFDLYTKDDRADLGIEPNDIPPHLSTWLYGDIVVRNYQGHGPHQNPIYEPGDPVYVYVKVRNQGCTASTGTNQLKLYWSKTATKMKWPDFWDGSTTIPNGKPIGDEIGTMTIPALAPNEEVILEFEWYPPNPSDYASLTAPFQYPWSFSLLSRIVSTADPMTFQEVSNTFTNVKSNNNIALKNVTVICLPCKEQPVTAGGVIAIGNTDETVKTYDFEFCSIGNTDAKLYEEAEIIVKLDDESWNKWVEGGQETENMEVFNEEERQFIVTDSLGILKNLTFDGQERSLLSSSFHFLIEEVTDQEEYVFTVTQRKSDGEREVVGTHLYQIFRDAERQDFRAGGTMDQSNGQNTPVLFSADTIAEPAVYNWYAPDGTLIHTGKEFTYSPKLAGEYKLEVIAESDLHKDYSTITVEAAQNADQIIALTPNPASNSVTVQYQINNASSAYLKVVNLQNNTFANCIVNLNANQTTIDISTYQTGIYPVVLVVDGQALHAVNLIIN